MASPCAYSSGVVTSVGYDSDGKVSLSVGGKIVAYDSIVGISVPTTKSNVVP